MDTLIRRFVQPIRARTAPPFYRDKAAVSLLCWSLRSFFLEFATFGLRCLRNLNILFGRESQEDRHHCRRHLHQPLDCPLETPRTLARRKKYTLLCRRRLQRLRVRFRQLQIYRLLQYLSARARITALPYYMTV